MRHLAQPLLDALQMAISRRDDDSKVIGKQSQINGSNARVAAGRYLQTYKQINNQK